MIKSLLRRAVPLLLAVLILLSALPASVQAAYNPAVVQQIEYSLQTGESADLREYLLTPEELADHLIYTYYTGTTIPWYADHHGLYNRDYSTNLVTFYHPKHLDKVLYDRPTYELRVAEILDAAIHDGMNQWQMALAIHDYIIANGCYDISYTYYEGYDMAVRKTAVCMGYAELYKDLLLRVGIPCIMVRSDEMDHCWNMVQLGGNWYHVDVTWDDPTDDTAVDTTGDTYGQVRHTYFLVTDAEMTADHEKRLKDGRKGHYNWEFAHPSTDTTFQKAFWKNVTSQICFSSAKTCYLRRISNGDHYIYKRSLETGKETKLYTIKKAYIDIGRSNKCNYGHVGGLSLWNGRLYFGTLNKVYSMKTNGKDVKTEYSHKTASEKTYIRSAFVKDDTLYLDLRTHEGTVSQASKKLADTGFHVHNYDVQKTPATCDVDGTAIYTCSCGLQVQTVGDWAPGHNYVLTETFRPTCTENGYALYVCHCGDSYAEPRQLAHGHSYFPTKRSNATCTEDGYIVYTCCHCDDSYTQPGDSATGHHLLYTEVAPTCTEQGYDLYTCSFCSYQELYPTLGPTNHDYRRTTVTRNGINKTGQDLYTCRDCGHYYYKTTPALTFREWLTGK